MLGEIVRTAGCRYKKSSLQARCKQSLRNCAFRPLGPSGCDTMENSRPAKKFVADCRNGSDILLRIQKRGNGMLRTVKKIEALTKEIEQKNALLSDLTQKAKEESRRADTRRKIIYGAAFLAYADLLSPENAEKAFAAVRKQITNKKDRDFLGIGVSNKP
ncbi:MAG: hypothetical protein ACKVLA_04850 [Rhodobacterales bacterium]